jgi:hypothetical protein
VAVTFWHRSFTFISNKSPTWYNNFSVYYPDVCLQLNMFRTFSPHHQELNDCSGSLWFYLRIVVLVVLCSWSGRPAGLFIELTWNLSSFDIFRYLSTLQRKNVILFGIKQLKALLYWIMEVFNLFSPKTHRAKKMYLWKNESLFKYVELSSEPILKRDSNRLNAELIPICHLLALLGAHHILQVSRIRVKFLSHTRMAKKTYSRKKLIKLFLFLRFRTFSMTLLKGYVRNEIFSGN